MLYYNIMRKIIFVILVILILSLAGMVRCKVNRLGLTGSEAGDSKQARDEFIGEKITYNVKFGSFNLGKAVFQHLENEEMGGKQASKMTFETDLLRFYDLETIYSDPVTFLPIRVTRKIKGWSINEDIVEVYDQKNFILTITKFVDRKKEEVQFDKIAQPIHNAVLLPFYVRRIANLKIGWSFLANFGNQQFKIILSSIENIKIPAGVFQAFRFESVPKKFSIWITTDKRRVPVKIQDSGILGYTLIMKEYTF